MSPKQILMSHFKNQKFQKFHFKRFRVKILIRGMSANFKLLLNSLLLE